MQLLIGILLLGGGFYFLFMAIRCRANPAECQDLFMTKQGFSYSIIAKLHYRGNAAAVRQLLLEDRRIQRLFVVELSIRSVIIGIIGLLVLSSS